MNTSEVIKWPLMGKKKISIQFHMCPTKLSTKFLKVNLI